MKPCPSYTNNQKKPIIDLTRDGIDLSMSYDDRKNEKKVFYKQSKNRKDRVYFVELGTTADYGGFFKEYLDDAMSLNTKGPFANLYWSFACEETNGERRVS